MAIELLPVKNQTPVLYSVSDAAIAEIRSRCAGLKADGTDGYEEVRKAIAGTRKLRGDVEKERVALKEASLEYGRAVDNESEPIPRELGGALHVKSDFNCSSGGGTRVIRSGKEMT